MATHRPRDMLIDVQNGRAWRNVTAPGVYNSSQLVFGAPLVTTTHVLFTSSTIVSDRNNAGNPYVFPASGQIVSVRLVTPKRGYSTTLTVDVFIGAGANVAKLTTINIPTAAATSTITRTFSPYFDYTGGQSLYFNVRTTGRDTKGLTAYVEKYESSI